MPIAKKIHCLERPQYAFLDHGKTLVFSDVIKEEILFLNIRLLAPFVSIPRAPKKLHGAMHLNYLCVIIFSQEN